MTYTELRQQVELAISNNQLVLEYQPKICTKTFKVNGVEALVRWNHPELGRMLPAHWVPALSNSPVISKLGEWVVRQAMCDHKKWSSAGHDFTVAVNIGPEHFSSPSFTKWLVNISRELKFEPANMEIEVTENTLFSTTSSAENVLSKLHEAGFLISLDDFGAGYSNLSRMSDLHVDVLKIDWSVVARATVDVRVSSLMSCIVMMARELDCKIVAEGVETEKEERLSIVAGVDMMQGFRFSKSLPYNDLMLWVDNYYVTQTNKSKANLYTKVA